MAFIRVFDTFNNFEILINTDNIIHITQSNRKDEEVFKFVLIPPYAPVLGKILSKNGSPITCSKNMIKICEFLNKKGD